MAAPPRCRWPPGFRFRPTDQELVAFYLARKVHNKPIQPGVIAEVDLYKCEPWDLPDKSEFEDVEWYFFSPRDKKYPNGSRTNRATEAGYWKATGKDRAVRAGSKGVGMKKTLVFYKGRAPHGQRTDWIMHEYRLEESGSSSRNCSSATQLDSFVLCRVFRKTTAAKNEEDPAPGYYEDDNAEVCWPSPLLSTIPSEEAAVEEPAVEEAVVEDPVAEPEEGQVCLPSPEADPPPLTQQQQDADDSLNEFLMMLLDEPATDSQVPLLSGGQNEVGHSLVDETGLLEQLEQQTQCGDNLAAGDVMDLLSGDFLELNDILPPQQQQQQQQHVDFSAFMADIQPADNYYYGNSNYVNSATLQQEEQQLVVQGGEQEQSDEERNSVRRFLNMLGSIQVLPASAAEPPKAEQQHIQMNVSVVTITCNAYNSKQAATTGSDLVKRQDDTQQQQHVGKEKQRRQQAISWQRQPRRSNLLFVFLLGSMSALFWVLVLPCLSRLASYVHAAVL